MESSGISLKPTTKQLNEFTKKIKNLNHQLILKYLFERMNKSVIENDNKILGKLLCAIQAIIQDSSNTKYIDFLKQQAKLFENIFNKNINKMINITSAEIYKSLTNTNLIKADDFLNDKNKSNNNIENNNTSNRTNAPNPLDAFINKANQKIAKYNTPSQNNENPNEEKDYNFIKKKEKDNPSNNSQNYINNNQNNMMNNKPNTNLLTNIEDDIISNINNNLNINNNQNQNNNTNQNNNMNNSNNIINNNNNQNMTNNIKNNKEKK